MRKLSKDIIEYKLPKPVENRLRADFYRICRKHGIFQGRKVGRGVQINNYEWTVARWAFLKSVISQLELNMILGTPKDLYYRGRKK